MFKKPFFIMLAMASVAFPASAKNREIGQAELRSHVSTGKSMSVNRVLSRIRNRIDGEIIDVRAFDVNGVYFRMMIMKPNGRVGSLVVNGKTGRPVPATSNVSAAVETAAKISGGNTGNNGNSGGNGNAGGNGNGGGNNQFKFWT